MIKPDLGDFLKDLHDNGAVRDICPTPNHHNHRSPPPTPSLIL